MVCYAIYINVAICVAFAFVATLGTRFKEKTV